MKKLIIIFSIIGVAAILLFSLDFIGSGGSEINSKSTNPEIIKKFNDQINILRDSFWDKKKYSSIKTDISLHQSNGLITKDEEETLTKSLELSYASSMIKSFDDWITNKCNTNIDLLYSAMTNQSNISYCKSLLSEDITTYTAYRFVLAFPNKVSNFLSGQFEEEKYYNLNSEIMNISGGRISNCPKVLTIKNEQLIRLKEFKTFKAVYDLYFAQGEKKFVDYYCGHSLSLDPYSFYRLYFESHYSCN